MTLSVSTPFWGAPTSYLNFCEEDYVITRYVAEFINTLSSFTYIIYGIYGLIQLHQKKQTGSRSIPYCGLIGVGICSGGYHMTLKYHTQMSDELSMHLLTTPLLYRILTFQASPQFTKIARIVLSLLFTIVMVVHMVMDEFLLHAVSFGTAVLLITIRTLKIIPGQISDVSTRKTIQNVASFGVASFVFGYLVWLIDELACRVLLSTREVVGLPLAFFLELHGWWHVFTAIGGYIAVAIIDLITSGEVQADSVEHLAWPLPIVARFMAPGAEASKEK
ncbi:alkaline phytoceramidase [Aspergillus heteromorphus CBS 117.55]|uniref:Alkaline phytoceramidase n=1 Tax=Aspergillus heteromorphus CBS 117.55 TaxID=1448321 RepID=A0A317VPI0_9EURO|nr:alkaline phytoceramidase [Aspergillus heteromorphus CBS 117.55]PWY75519.1 alkaline phytoceramidase [Aspergillus heteromorphus CBS 117.55]